MSKVNKLDDYIFESTSSLQNPGMTSARHRRLEDVMTSSSVGVTWSGSQSNIASFGAPATTIVSKTGEEVVVPKVTSQLSYELLNLLL